MAKDAAGGPLAGFLWQVHLGLLRLLDMDDDQVLSLEAHDDLGVLSGAGVVTVMEQAKHTLAAGKLSLRSKSFWNAIGLWASKVAASNYLPSLILTTNRCASPQIAPLLETNGHATQQEIETLRDSLNDIASEYGNASLSHRYTAWLALDDSERQDLLKRVRVRDEPSLAGLTVHLERALGRAGVPRDRREEFRERLEGWYNACVRERLTHLGMTIRASEQKARLFSLYQGCSTAGLTFAHADLAVDLAALVKAGESGRTYYRQLELVGASEDLKLRSVDFFHKARMERQHLLANIVGLPELQAHEADLENAWQIERLDLARQSHTSKECEGLAVLFACLKLQSILRGSRVPIHLHVGTLHLMADGPDSPPRIGWHPAFVGQLADQVTP